MSIKTLVLDFDGTFTDIEAEAVPFQPAFLAGVADLLGRDVRADWIREKEAIERAPEQYGWVFEGKVVAPASADPYLLATAIVQGIFDGQALLRNPKVRTEITQALYRLAYEQTLTAFRPEAGAVLRAAFQQKDLGVFVVTNSDTAAVLRKLEKLLGSEMPAGFEGRVRGNAKKFWVTPSETSDPLFARLDETQRVQGLPRPVYLRRGKYYDTLARIWKETGTTPQETLVCGDIYELDLALPAALGARVALVERPTVLAYERAAVKAVGGHLLPSLAGLLSLLELQPPPN